LEQQLRHLKAINANLDLIAIRQLQHKGAERQHTSSSSSSSIADSLARHAKDSHQNNPMAATTNMQGLVQSNEHSS
jgi:hypothetical protein